MMQADALGPGKGPSFPARSGTPEQSRLLSVTGLARKGAFGPLDFSLRRGEILGFAGLPGAGCTEVARAVCGADPGDEGTIKLGRGEVRIRSPIEAIRHGIVHLPEKRKLDGLAARMSLAATLTLANLAGVPDRSGWIDAAAGDAAARQGGATPSPAQAAGLLYGGSQQKVAIGKWLLRSAKIIFFDEPTRGLGNGARRAVYELMDQLAAGGIGVVLISSELPEIMGMTDRVVVFREGQIMDVLNTRETTQEAIVRLASARLAPLATQI